jgi:hypothetical protein
MTPIQFSLALKKLGFSRVEFSNFVDAHPRTVARWASGNSSIPGSVSQLLFFLNFIQNADSVSGITKLWLWQLNGGLQSHIQSNNKC